MKGKTRFLVPITIREAAEGITIPDDECHISMVVSTDGLDGHGSHMTEKTLINYADDLANANIPLINAHLTGEGMERHIGSFFEGHYEKETKRTHGVARMLRDTDDTPEYMRVNEIIRRAERGLYDSVSVGFHGANEICNLCDKDIWDTQPDNRCPHIPLRRYPEGLCTYRVDGGHLVEVSFVPKGSNPNAKITNLREWSPELLEAKKVNEERLTIAEKDGRAWRQKLIEKAIAEGVRSDGGFDSSKWRARMETWESQAIIEQTEIFTELGDKRFGTGGRKTKEQGADNGTGSGSNSNFVLPSSIFGY